jgi:hypothetical protein
MIKRLCMCGARQTLAIIYCMPARFESWRAGELESWRAGELESWRAGELESWRGSAVRERRGATGSVDVLRRHT